MSLQLKVLLDYVDNNNNNGSKNKTPQYIEKYNASNILHRSSLFNYYDNTITKLMASLFDISEKNDLAALLLKRAIISMLQCNFYASLEDAYQSIGMASHVPESYLCAGQILVSMAKYNDAIDIYDRGLFILSSPSPSSFDNNSNNHVKVPYQNDEQKYQELLRNLKQEALLQMNRTTPMGMLFKKLSTELLHLIFTNYLSIQDRVVCSRVCPAWRMFVLNQLPLVWHELVLEDMPESVMEQLLVRENTGSNDSHDNKIRKITLEFDDYDYFESKSLKSKAYEILSQNNYKHVETFELRGDPTDGILSIKKNMRLFLQACSGNLKQVVLYENLSPQLVSDILTTCPNIMRLLSTTEESKSRYFLMQHRNQEHEEKEKHTHTSRSVQFNNMKRMSYVMRSHAAKVFDEYAERGSTIGDEDLKQMSHRSSLIHLEIEGLPIPAFRAPFWQKVSCLQHLILGEPRTPHLFDEVQVKLLFALHQHCPNLITLRCGYYFKDKAVLPPPTITTKKGLKEITLRPMLYRRNMICKPCLGMEAITSLVEKSYYTLQILHLPIEVFNILLIRNIAKTTLPLLQELGLYTDRATYDKNNGQEYNDNNVLKPQETKMLVQKCPLLNSIVLNAPTSKGSLLEMTKLCQLQNIYFIRSILDYFPNVTRGKNTSSTTVLHHDDDEPTISHSGVFFANCTTLKQVTVRGSFFTDQDLDQLMVNNAALDSLSIHGCDQLTTHGVTAALQQQTITNQLRSFTFVKLHADIDFYQIMLALPSSIQDVTWVVTLPNDTMQNPQSIHHCLGQVIKTKSASNNNSFCPTVRVLVRITGSFKNTNMIVFYCTPDKGIVYKRKNEYEAKITLKHLLVDILYDK